MLALIGATTTLGLPIQAVSLEDDPLRHWPTVPMMPGTLPCGAFPS